MNANIDTTTQVTLCHHCGKQIVFNRTYPDKRNSYWAHAILVYNGKSHTLGNALMEQRCADGRNWATPKRTTRNERFARMMAHAEGTL